MQVSTALKSDDFAIIGGGQARKFRINANASFFKILSDGLYQHKERAVVRETICNIYDAHVMAGTPDRAAEITLSTSQITFRDFGPGIPDEKMEEIYCNYGGSTKTNDDNQIGGFGLGCKSPFSVTDHFMTTSYHAGFKRTYALTMGDDDNGGEPTIKQMACQPTTETGMMVTIPLSTQTQYQRFEAELKSFLILSGIKGTINGEEIAVRDYSGIEETGFGLFKPRIGGQNGATYIMYGRVLYPLTGQIHEDIKELVEKLSIITRSTAMDLVLRVPPSSIEILPSREGVAYSERTLEVIKKVGWRAHREIMSHLPSSERQIYMAEIGKHPRAEFHKVHRHFTTQWRTNGDIPDRAIGGKAASLELASCTVRKNHTSLKYRRLAAGFYRDGRRFLLSDSYNENYSQYQYLLRKVLRIVGDVDRPNLQFRTALGSRMQKVTVEGNRQPIPTLTIAPSRTAALTADRGGFFLIGASLKPEQIAEIERKARMFRFKVHYAKAAPALKTRNKIVVEKPEQTTKFTPLKFGGIVSKRGYGEIRRFEKPSIDKPIAFMPLNIQSVIVTKKPKPCEIGPMQPAIKQTVFGMPASISGTFTKRVLEDKVAVPLNEAEKKRLLKMGVPRLCEYVLAKLRKMVKPQSDESAFTAYMSLYADNGQYYSWNNSGTALRFAMKMAEQNRRAACAVFLQKYRPSKKLDEIFKTWRLARKLFGIDTRSYWADQGEAAVFEDCRQQYKLLIQEFNKHQEPTMIDFLCRFRDGKLTIDDCGHLTFIAKVFNPNCLSNLKPDEFDRLMKIIEDDGKRYLSGKLPKQKAKLKLHQSSTDEEEDEE